MGVIKSKMGTIGSKMGRKKSRFCQDPALLLLIHCLTQDRMDNFLTTR